MATKDQEKEILAGWVDIVRDDHIAIFSELDVLLRSLDRYFIMDNLPASKQSYNAKDMRFELDAAKDGILRVLTLLETIIPESHRNAYWFQKFAENKLMDNRGRDIMRAGMYKQDSPEKSVYVLFDTFINLKSLTFDLLRNQDIQFMSFKNLGEILSKEIRENLYFNPFGQEINRDFDFIDNEEITRIVRGIEDKTTKKTISIMFITLFRLLRYLKTMDHRSLTQQSMNCSLLIFSLIKSEVESLRNFIDMSALNIEDDELEMVIQSLSYQIGMESKRVFQQELKDISECKSDVQLRGRIEASRGILKNLVEHVAIQLAKHWGPKLRGEDVFDVFITKAAQSMKLREDTYVLNRLINAAISSEEGSRSGVFSMLMNYMEYYENFTFKLLRYADYEQFSELFNKLREGYQRGENTQDLIDTGHQFNIYLDATLGHIGQRADLEGKPLDNKKADDIVNQYLSSIS